ncbi:hypothetical protein H5410_030441 [Solanum commersonii]|uniref:Uncharacterized protein n=1 Tax=Solanum commersonii TaxID=4109 RepID=A0A9J5YGW5_SOLCO|nr:hypothetical protein H5410_030441 [Solanum commersonii]
MTRETRSRYPLSAHRIISPSVEVEHVNPAICKLFSGTEQLSGDLSESPEISPTEQPFLDTSEPFSAGRASDFSVEQHLRFECGNSPTSFTEASATEASKLEMDLAEATPSGCSFNFEYGNSPTSFTEASAAEASKLEMDLTEATSSGCSFNFEYGNSPTSFTEASAAEASKLEMDLAEATASGCSFNFEYGNSTTSFTEASAAEASKLEMDLAEATSSGCSFNSFTTP